MDRRSEAGVAPLMLPQRHRTDQMKAQRNVFFAIVLISLAGGYMDDARAGDGSPAISPSHLTIYSVDDLPVYRLGPGGQPVFDPSPLVMYLKQKIGGKSWRTGGHRIVVNQAAKALLVHQSGSNHEEIASILQRIRLFSRSINAADMEETILEAHDTHRRVLLLVSRPETAITVDLLAVLEDPGFGKVADHYMLRCVSADRVDRLGDAIDQPETRVGPGLYVIGGDGVVVDRLFETDPRRDRNSIRDFLSSAAVPLPTAETVLRSGLKRAKEQTKKVLLIVSGPGCVHCIRLKAFLGANAKRFAKDYVQVVVDTRMPDVEAVTAPLGRSGDEIPWYAVVDSQGNSAVTSESKTGNIGFPADDEDRLHFRSMFERTRDKMSEADLEKVFQSLSGR